VNAEAFTLMAWMKIEIVSIIDNPHIITIARGTRDGMSGDIFLDMLINFCEWIITMTNVVVVDDITEPSFVVTFDHVITIIGDIIIFA
jgi:hypothetical protein